MSFSPHSAFCAGTNLSTRHYHVHCYNTTVISSHLSDCLSPPLTLTWTLMSKMHSTVCQVACGYLNVCTERRCSSLTQRVWGIYAHMECDTNTSLNAKNAVRSDYFNAKISSFPVSTVPSFTFTPTGTCNTFHLCSPLIFDVFGKLIIKVMMFYSAKTTPMLWSVVTNWFVQFSNFFCIFL